MTLKQLNAKAEELSKQYENLETVVFKPIYSTSNSNVLAQYLDETPGRILSRQLSAWLTEQKTLYEFDVCEDDYIELELEVEVAE